MNTPSHKKNQGYSLIELVAVTATSGVLAASALPHFIDFKDEARQVVFKGLERSIMQAATMAQAQQRLSGFAANEAIIVEGKPVAMYRTYPTRAAMGNLVNNSDFSYQPEQGRFVWKHAKHKPCHVAYTPSVKGHLPVVQSEEGGC